MNTTSHDFSQNGGRFPRTLISFLMAVAVTIAVFPAETSLAQTKTSDVEEIIIAFKMHFDIGYTDMAEGVLQKYRTSLIANTLDNVKQSRSLSPEKRFVWTLPAWPMHYILDNADSSMVPEIENALKSGQFAIHALPITFETEASDLEMLVRGFTFSTALSKRYGLPLPRDAKLTDVPSHSWALPTILRNAGVDILHIGCNPASRSPEVPLIFWWEGPDGSRLLTMYWGLYYGTSLVPPEGWKHKTWLAIVHTHENTGAPTMREVEETLAEVHRLAPKAKVRIGRISDFHDALMKEKPDIPVIRGDMPDTWIHGYLSMPKEVGMDKFTQRGLFNLEALNTLYGIWNGKAAGISPIVATTVENSILFDEHTFGIAMSHGQVSPWAYGEAFAENRALGKYDYIEQSWREKGNRAQLAERTWLPEYQRQLTELASSVNIEGERVVVYNPLPWARSGVVKFHMGVFNKQKDIAALRDTKSGTVTPAYNDGNFLCFTAADVPPMGYRTYIPVPPPADTISGSKLAIDEQRFTLENEYLRVVFDPESGAIASLTDKKSGRELAGKPGDYRFGQYFQEKFGKADADRYNTEYIKDKTLFWAYLEMTRPPLPPRDHQTLTGKNPRITFRKTDSFVSAVLHFSRRSEGPDDYRMTCTLYRNTPYAELTWGVNDKQADPWPEAGWLAFPVNVEKPLYRLLRTGSIVDPARDYIRGTNTDYCFVNTGLAVVNSQGTGLGINTPDAPGVSLDRPGLMRHSGNFVPEKPSVFINLYNNQWGTNFTEWIEGSWRSRVYLWSIERYDPEASLVTPIEETRTPLDAGYFSGAAGRLPAVSAGVSISRKGIPVTAFARGIEGGTLLRFWELSGKNGDCTVQLPASSGFTRAIPCDLRNRPTGEALKVSGHTFTFAARANAPASFILY